MLTAVRGISPVATRSRVHSCDPLEVCQECQHATSTADGDNVVFQRLAHRFERALAERSLADHGRVGGQRTGHRIDVRHVERLIQGQRR